MEINQFVYWLQGAIEMNPDMLEKGMTSEQVQTIQDHLDLVFNKVTPDRFEKKKESLNIYTDYPNNGGGYCSPSTNVDATIVAIC